MDFEELLKAAGLDDDAVAKVLAGMKKNKVYTAGEENLDIRYKKLKETADADTEKIKTLEAAAKDKPKDVPKDKAEGKDDPALGEKAGAKAVDETQALKDEIKQLKVDSAIKLALASAKATDPGYLAYKLSEGKQTITIAEDGSVTGIDEAIKGLQTSYPSFFTGEGAKKIDENKLPGGKKAGDSTVTPEQFKKMKYGEKNKLYQEDLDTYKALQGQ